MPVIRTRIYTTAKTRISKCEVEGRWCRSCINFVLSVCTSRYQSSHSDYIFGYCKIRKSKTGLFFLVEEPFEDGLTRCSCQHADFNNRQIKNKNQDLFSQHFGFFQIMQKSVKISMKFTIFCKKGGAEGLLGRGAGAWRSGGEIALKHEPLDRPGAEQPFSVKS